MAKVAIIGINGLVGKELEKLIKTHTDWEISSLGSSDEIDYEELRKKNIVFLCVDNEVSSAIAPNIYDYTTVIDNSSYFRMEKDIPLVVPEINMVLNWQERKNKKLIANPNCSTIQLVIPLKPILDHYGIEEVFVATYQSVSGAGKRALEEFKDQVKNNHFENKYLPYPMAYNLFPVIGSFFEDDPENIICTEEKKIIEETNKILESSIKVYPFTVRVPTIRTHCQAVFVKTVEDFRYEDILKLFDKFSISGFLKVWLDNNLLPQPYNVSNTYEVHLARIRKLNRCLLGFWSASDNLLRGAAYNAFLIAKKLLADTKDR
ncbi:MAG: aspartate-semialdehyde dehydrogenase [Candidatus Calescibacterium sp.]|nr:aspartate-semialdehyde dehydrogenase [Candidatus Calescibacterium sp.]MCX7971860.1 aspartate-semialdehyde dehydrogenase [bacterium]MDW8195041.1 aspartate-semialdehyde dehydrogenase [Candidatus Calescibacterium sp.]